DVDQVGPRQHRHRRRLEQHHRLCTEQRPALGKTVGIDAAEEGKEQDGGEAHRRQRAERERRIRQLQNQPRLGDLLHPGAGLRNELADPEEAVVAIVQRPEGLPEWWTRTRRGGRGSHWWSAPSLVARWRTCPSAGMAGAPLASALAATSR